MISFAGTRVTFEKDLVADSLLPSSLGYQIGDLVESYVGNDNKFNNFTIAVKLSNMDNGDIVANISIHTQR